MLLNCCCVFSLLGGVLSTHRRGDMGMMHMSDIDCDSRYLVMIRFLIRNQVFNIFEIEIVFTC